jgi:hypothetical protein
MTNITIKEYCSTEEVVNKLKVAYLTIYRWMKINQLGFNPLIINYKWKK